MEQDIGFVALGICKLCGIDTFAADEVCMDCRDAIEDNDILKEFAVCLDEKKDCE